MMRGAKRCATSDSNPVANDSLVSFNFFILSYKVNICGRILISVIILSFFPV